METIAIPRKGGGRPRSAKLDEIERDLMRLPAGDALILDVEPGHTQNSYRNKIRMGLAQRELEVETSTAPPVPSRKIAVWLKNGPDSVSY